MVKKTDIIGLILSTLFISFFIAGLSLINMVFTIAPFAIYGVETGPITINVGAVLIIISLICLLLATTRKGKR
jgi:hypothetical protein